MYNKPLVLNGNKITVVYNKMYENVAKMVLKYYDTEQFTNTLFSVCVLINENSEIVDFRNEFPNFDKYIYYQLRNIYLYPEYVIYEHMGQFDEVWDYSAKNIEYYPHSEIKEIACFMPLRYIDMPIIEPKENYKYDIGFIGTLTPFREDMIARITKFWTNDYCRVKILNGYSYSELYANSADVL